MKKIITKNKKSVFVSASTVLEKIMQIKGAEKILAKNKVPCLSCPMVSFEVDKLKIGEICKSYGLNLPKILKELNSIKN